MSGFHRQPDQTLAVLGIMRDLAERGHGYEACGVRGWARSMDVNQLLEVYYPERRYADAGVELRVGWQVRAYYTRVDVRVEGRPSSEWIYRIRDDAARMLNARDKREHVPIPPPADGMEFAVWMPETVPDALDALRWAAENEGATVHVPGEPEWRTSLELTGILSEQTEARRTAREAAGEPVVDGNREPAFAPGDLRWLVNAGLAAERRVERKLVYRLTVAGVNTRPLEWHGPRPKLTPRPG